MVDEVPQLVQEAERDAVVPPRDAQVDGVAVAEAVAAALARRRRRPHRNRLEVGVENVQRVCGCERAGKLRMERAAPGQPENVGQGTARTRGRCARRQAAAAGAVCGVGASACNLRARADAADNAHMRIVLVLLIPLLLFSAWQYTRREENENRLALVASAVALRDVDVSCPGFWTRLSRSRRTPAGSPSTSTAGRPTRPASPRRRAGASSGSGAGSRARSPVSLTGGCDEQHARRGQRHRHARARVVAPARHRQRGADAVLRRPDGGGGRASASASQRPMPGRSPCASPPRMRGLPKASTTRRNAGPEARYDLRPETPAWPSG